MSVSLQFLSALFMLAVPISFSSLTSDQKAEILRAHNYFRGRVDPIATDMLRLEWDDDLSYIAQFWATNCHYSYNGNRNDQSSEFDYVGEIFSNVSTASSSSSSAVNYTHLIYKWFSLHKHYNFYTGVCRDSNSTKSATGEHCSSYKQLVWANTHGLGCGAMKCETLYNGDNSARNMVFFVCNYGPGGSFEGHKPYTSGNRVCSSCPSGRSLCINKLCTSQHSGSLTVHMLHVLFYIILLLCSIVYI